jgi:amino acid adenylation domain-containing protein
VTSDHGAFGVESSPEEKDFPAESLHWDTIEVSLPARFERCVEVFRDRPAVVENQAVWTYDQLNRAANRVARTLLAERGQVPEPIAVLFDQGSHFLAGLLGVLKAGKFYVPLDPLFPNTRNDYILKDSGAGMLLTDAKYLPLAKGLSGGRIPVLEIERCDSPADESNPGLSLSPETLGLIIYTSGSTGQPKGVLHNHHTLVHNAVRQHDLMRFSPRDRLSMLYSSSVMGTVRDFTNALLNGASLYPFDVRIHGLTRLVDFLEENRITVFHTIPSVFRRLDSLVNRSRQFSSLRFVILGGETVLRADFEVFRRHFPDSCRLFTGLGLTETGTIRQNVLTSNMDVEEAVVPLGYPVRDVEILLLDEAGMPVKAGEVGEITVRCPYIALEYWNKPEETRAVFSNDQNHEEMRTFRTGDMGEQLPDGSLIHRGRKDFQVKVRGFRIELQEVEAAILETGLVKDVVVIGHDIRPGDKCLVAYILPHKGRTRVADELRLRLNELLPDHMVPAFYMELETLPLTPNGKVDRQALPRPDFSELSTDREPPRDAVEIALLDLWKEIFPIDRIGIDDNFFDLGGDSLLASVLFVEIDRRFGRLYPLSLLIEKNTIRKLADVLRDLNTGITRSLVGIKTEGMRPPLFIIPGGYGDVLYLRVLAKYFHPEQPLYGLQAAGLEGKREYHSNLEEIAAQYLMEISGALPHGPYLLAGHSFGGYVALEMARLLLKRKEQVALLAMIDTYPPGRRRQAPLRNRLLIHLENLRPMSGKQRQDYLRERGAQLILRLFHNPGLAKLLFRNISPEKRIFAFSRLARHNYDPAPYQGDIMLFEASERPWFMTWNPMETWPSYVSGNFQVYPVPGRHDSLLFEPHVQELAVVLNGQIEQTLAGLGLIDSP